MVASEESRGGGENRISDESGKRQGGKKIGKSCRNRLYWRGKPKGGMRRAARSPQKPYEGEKRMKR